MKIYGSPYLEWIKDLQMPPLNLGMSGMRFEGNLDALGLKAGEVPVAVHHDYGLPEFIDALSGRCSVPKRNIISGIGTSGANFHVFCALLSPGDEVIVETPVYDPLPFALKQAGAVVKFVPRRPENSWRLDPDDLKSIMTNRTRAVVITNLHNPTGALMSDDDLKAMSRIIAEREGWLIVDEVYLEFYFGKGPKTSFLLGDNIIVTSSLTKAFGLGPLRAGWIFAPGKLIDSLRRVYNLMVGVTPSITEYIAARILADDSLYGRFAANAEKLIEANLPLVDEFVHSRGDIDWVKPEGAVSGFIITDSPEKADNLHRLLLDEYKTLVMPGRFFDYPQGFRLGFGIPAANLREGLKNIGAALDRL